MRTTATRRTGGARRAPLLVLAAALVAGCSDAPDAPLDLATATVADVQTALASGATTCRELAQRTLARIGAVDDAGPALNAVLETNPDLLAQADALDAAWAAGGPVGPLHCVPLAVKDNYDTGDAMRTTAASLVMGDFVATEDAFSIARLRAAGALLVAKVNMDEFAFGVSGYSSRGGQTLDAYRRNRIPGGSSGGSAVAVAAGMAVLATGSDTAGSIRIPAAFNSLVGIKPTLGLVGRSGIVPISEWLDVPGPLARTVADAAVMLGVMAGVDPGDPATDASVGRTPGDYASSLDPDGLRGARVGVLREAFGEALRGQNAEVDAAFATALAVMGTRGAALVDPLAVPQAATDDETIALLTGLGNGFYTSDVGAYFAEHAPGAPVQSAAEIVAAATALGPDVVKNLQAIRDAAETPQPEGDELARLLAIRTRIVDAIVGTMDAAGVDALAFPTMLCPTPPLPDVIDPAYVCASAPPMPLPFSAAYGGDAILLASVAGLPEVTLPAGYTSDGAPIGLSFLGRPFAEATLVRLAYAFEQATLVRRPPDLGVNP